MHLRIKNQESTIPCCSGCLMRCAGILLYLCTFLSVFSKCPVISARGMNGILVHLFYVRLFKEAVGLISFILMHYNASPDRAHLVDELKKSQDIYLMNWVTRSCVLNQIRHVSGKKWSSLSTFWKYSRPENNWKCETTWNMDPSYLPHFQYEVTLWKLYCYSSGVQTLLIYIYFLQTLPHTVWCKWFLRNIMCVHNIYWTFMLN